MSFDRLQDWVGRTELREDVATAAPIAGLAAMLDYINPPWPQGEVPLLGHWLYFLDRAPQAELGPDGHAKRGGFLPPVPLPRRMWAGSDFEFLVPIPAGARISRLSTIAEVSHKTGRSGEMVFVKVEHKISTGERLAVREIHTIVYRDAPRLGETGPAPAKAPEIKPDMTRVITPDPVLLFRFSALTFNGHRIHYDRSYCRDVEGYPGLVFHGPLTGLLLLDLYRRANPSKKVCAFRFKAQKPLFDIYPFTIYGASRERGAELWALDHEGAIAMTAEVEAS